jgi:two-component system chemotaxis sensor kinase CheA
MEKDQLVRRLMDTFLEELQEHVQVLNRELLALQQEPAAAERAGRLKQLFRTAHSLKGAARSVSIPTIEEACHALEDILAGVRDGARPLSKDLFALLFAAADAIEEAGVRLREERDLTGSRLARLLPQLGDTARRAPLPVQPKESGDGVAAAAPAAGGNTLRIAADKLDTFLTRSGELLVACRRLDPRLQQLASLRDSVLRWQREWHEVGKPLAALLEEHRQPAADKLSPRRLARAVNGFGERLRKLEKELDNLTAALAADSRALEHVAGGLDDEVRRVRMLPFAQACQGLERMVNDLAGASGKDVRLVIEGGAVELDRSILEGLSDPLRHLVRNAVDHGLEPVEERSRQAKPRRAQVTVSALLRAAQVEVVVADDGRGLDIEALRREAHKRGLPEATDDRELARLIFQSGFSTAAAVTGISGRGVGLDVVKSQAENLHGTVDVAFEAGRGTRFTLTVPLTLTTLRAILVAVNGQLLAFAGTNVQRLLRVNPDDIRTIEGRPMVPVDGVPLPLVSLAAVLKLPKPQGESSSPGGRAAKRRSPALVISAGNLRMIFLVDELLSEQVIVVKRLGARIRRVPLLAGATILPSGQTALVLNAANLVRSALAQAPAVTNTVGPEPAPVRKRLLLAEDSVTTRTLEKTILEAAGYDVVPAADGAEAWKLLQQGGADLLVSDIDMPNMDGFTLTQEVRGSRRFRDLPVILVTAKESEHDRARGIDAGANAYLVKSAFDQRELLETIAHFLS